MFSCEFCYILKSTCFEEHQLLLQDTLFQFIEEVFQATCIKHALVSFSNACTYKESGFRITYGKLSSSDDLIFHWTQVKLLKYLIVSSMSCLFWTMKKIWALWWIYYSILSGDHSFSTYAKVSFQNTLDILHKIL